MEAVLESCVPPGFRFHPTEEELLGYYLARKVSSQKTDLQVIVDIDLYRIEPWDLQDRCKHGYEEQNEWYFFSHKDKKYPTGTRTNRATTAGFWKATGRDKAVLSRARIIGMRKTLVFYVGRAPNGRKTDWIIHEYRLQSSEHEPTQEEGWVVCRAFKKQIPDQRPCFNNTFNPNCYIKDYEQFRSDTHTDATRTSRFVDSCFDNNVIDQTVLIGDELESRQMYNHIFDIPRLDSPDLSTSLATKECFEANAMAASQLGKDCAGQFIDWKALDKLLASQVSESASSSNVHVVTPDYDADAQNQDQFIASFHS